MTGHDSLVEEAYGAVVALLESAPLSTGWWCVAVAAGVGVLVTVTWVLRRLFRLVWRRL